MAAPPSWPGYHASSSAATRPRHGVRTGPPVCEHDDGPRVGLRHGRDQGVLVAEGRRALERQARAVDALGEVVGRRPRRRRPTRRASRTARARSRPGVGAHAHARARRCARTADWSVVTRNGVTFPDPPPVTKRSLPAPSTAIDRSRPARSGSVPRRLTSSVVACSARRRAVRAWARRGIWASSSRKAGAVEDAEGEERPQHPPHGAVGLGLGQLARVDGRLHMGRGERRARATARRPARRGSTGRRCGPRRSRPARTP